MGSQWPLSFKAASAVRRLPMKTNRPFKAIAIVPLLFAAMVPVKLVVAEQLSGHLGREKRATDVWKFTCDSDANHLLFYVADDGPRQRPKLNAQLFKGNRATNATDPAAQDGDDAGNGSPTIKLRGGPGEYYGLLDKSGAGEKDYTAFV
jgi:hypothetical protein